MDQETNRQSGLAFPMSPAVSMTADATIAIIAEEGFDRVSVRSVAACSMGHLLLIDRMWSYDRTIILIRSYGERSGEATAVKCQGGLR